MSSTNENNIKKYNITALMIYNITAFTKCTNTFDHTYNVLKYFTMLFSTHHSLFDLKGFLHLLKALILELKFLS